MQQQMKSNKPGQGMCNKPGGKKPNMKGIGEQQKELNGQMQKMMEKGKGMSPSELAKMAAKQEAIRKQLKDAHEQIKKEGGKALGDMGSVLKDMKDTEEELKRKELTRETMMRQQQILNRLLDATRSVREKNEWDNKRKSNTGNQLDRKSPEELTKEEYQELLRREMLKSNQLEYSEDFILLIEKYYKLLETGSSN